MSEIPTIAPADFAALRTGGSVYVDKTEWMVRLAERPWSQFFLARPRGFGKTLLLSGFEALFRGRLELFKGLAAERLWREEEIYPVFRIDFSRVGVVKDDADFLSRLDGLFAESAARAGLEYDAVGKPFRSFGWMLMLQAKNDRRIVLLVDNCEEPVASNLDRPELAGKIQDSLSLFFRTVKSYDGVFRFVFVTGIARFYTPAGFASPDSLDDISFAGDFGALLGFTRQELMRDFSDRLRSAASCLGCSCEALLNELQANYGGYRFDRRGETEVFRPQPVLAFLADPSCGFRGLWREQSALEKVLAGSLRDGTLTRNVTDTYTACLEHLAWAQDAVAIDPVALCYQTGCLARKGSDPQGHPVLGCPNQEVAQALSRL